MALAKVAIFVLFLAQSHARKIEATGPVDREAMMREMEEEARHHSLVTYNKEAVKAAGSLENLQAQVQAACDCTVRNLAAIGAFVLDYESAEHIDAAEMLNIPDVTHATEDVVVMMNFDQERQSSTSNDPKFSDQWALQSLTNEADINCQEGWAAYKADSQGGSPDGPSVIVAVIDTGIDYTHPDLVDAMWVNPDEIAGDGIDNDGNGYVDDVYGADFTTGTGDPIDRNGHGTHCAGVIASPTDNNVGIAGIAGVSQGKAKLMAIKGLSDSGGGSLSSLYGGLNYAIEKGAKISSNSWGGRGNDGGSLADILANNPEHLFIAAAGNDNEQISESNQFVTGSTNAANQIVVGATTDNDARSWFSNYGKPYVHVMAPGSSIMSTLPGSAYGNLSGTSMACPQVSGLAALIMTMRDISGAQLKQLIEANVQQKSQYADFVTTSGLIDVLATVQAAAGDDSTPSPPDDSVCIDIKIRTERWGDENSWTFGSCSSSQSYGNYQDYTEECCQPAGSYDLTCKCSYGDGWHDGYIQIGDSEEQYCLDFEDGSEQVVEDIAHGAAGGDVCLTIKTTTLQWGNENSWTFGACTSSTKGYESQGEYEEECCQPAGSYDLVCNDSYGDGWHGGYVQVGDSDAKLCEDFTEGASKTVGGVAH